MKTSTIVFALGIITLVLVNLNRGESSFVDNSAKKESKEDTRLGLDSFDSNIVRSSKRTIKHRLLTKNELIVHAKKSQAKGRMKDAIKYLDVAVERHPEDGELIRLRSLYDMKITWGKIFEEADSLEVTNKISKRILNELKIIEAQQVEASDPAPIS